MIIFSYTFYNNKKEECMEWLVTLIFLSLAAYLIYSGKKKSSVNEQAERDDIKKRWEDINNKRYKKS